jgi:hypothetical protein
MKAAEPPPQTSSSQRLKTNEYPGLLE